MDERRTMRCRMLARLKTKPNPRSQAKRGRGPGLGLVGNCNMY